MAKKVLIGTVTLEKDVVMYNNQFQYTASFEELKVEKGTYPIYTYEDEYRDGRLHGAYLGFEGTVVAGNIGNKVGSHSRYDQYWYGYSLADCFIDGYDYVEKIIRREFELRPEWGIKLDDFVSSFDSKRCFVKSIVRKDGAELTYMD